MLAISYWVVPIFSSVCWIAMLITMLSYWASTGKPRYSTMSNGQTIPYISDIGADILKPMFIAMSAITVVTFDLAFIFERYLRHTGKLAPNTSIWQKVYSACATLTAIVGAAGLILLSIFDVKHHPRMHDTFLGVFIIGYIISAIFICWEYQRLGIHYRQSSILRYSFWIKLFFILSEIILAIAFGTCSKTQKYNPAAILEWIIAFIYCFYVLSFFIDFLPAIKTKHHQSSETEMQVAEEGISAVEPGTETGRGGVIRESDTPIIGDGAAEGRQYFRGHTTAPRQNNTYKDTYTHAHSHTSADRYDADDYGHTIHTPTSAAANIQTPSRNF